MAVCRLSPVLKFFSLFHLCVHIRAKFSYIFSFNSFHIRHFSYDILLILKIKNMDNHISKGAECWILSDSISLISSFKGIFEYSSETDLKIDIEPIQSGVGNGLCLQND